MSKKPKNPPDKPKKARSMYEIAVLLLSIILQVLILWNKR